MNKIIMLFLFFLLSPTIVLANEDPFKELEHLKLKNGLTVILAPTKTASKFYLEVVAPIGFREETPDRYGVSHLLEHVLFRNSSLKKNSSYLDLIKEAKGYANGETKDFLTTYFAIIPKKKAMWLSDNFFTMIFEPSFTEENIQKEITTVQIERGLAHPIATLLGFSPGTIFLPPYLELPDVYESHFGVKFPKKFDLTEEQLSTKELTLEKVKEHYRSYYYPSNLTLYVSGNFEKEPFKNYLNSKWGTVKNWQGLPKNKYKPTPKNRPYFDNQIAEDSPSVDVGFLLWDLKLEDYEIISSYLLYLSHRLQKKIRNEAGESYSGASEVDYTCGFGTGMVYFDTTPDSFGKNFDLVKKLIHSEVVDGKLTDRLIEESKSFYLADFTVMAKSAGDMQVLAKHYSHALEEFDKFESPYLILNNISSKEYRETLVKYFKPEHSYTFLDSPPLIFLGDIYFIFALGFLLFLLLTKRFLLKPFNNLGVRWVRNIKSPPLFLAHIAYFLIAIFVFLHVELLIRYAFYIVTPFGSSVISPAYLLGIASSFSMTLVYLGVTKMFPTKLLVVDDKLIIKTLSYSSSLIPLNKITQVHSLHWFSFRFFSLMVKSIRYRFYYRDPLFWKKGLLVSTTDGRAFYFSVKDANIVAEELQSLLPKTVRVNELKRKLILKKA